MWNNETYSRHKPLWFNESKKIPDISELSKSVENALSDCGIYILRTGTVITKDETLELAKKLGTPLNQSPEGCDIFEVKNEGYDPNHPKFRGPSSNRALTFHTDRCDIIMFHCVKQAGEGGVNMLVHAETVHDILQKEDPEALKTLKGKFYYKRHNADPAHPHTTYTLPVFDFAKEVMSITLMTYLIDKADSDPDLPSLSTQQRHALNKLQEICQRPEVQLKFRLEPGDFLFLNNVKMLHSRTAFKDNAEPRLYYRIWLSVPWSQQLPESFSSLFGSVDAGTVRGGFKKF